MLAASIGIAIYPQDGETIADLMRNADIAMYRAKEKGGNRYIFFEENMNAEVNKRAAIERELRNAIVEGQFVLYYQPQVEPNPDWCRVLKHWCAGIILNGVLCPQAFSYR
ncbi:MAG: diguanylate cyclase [Burkholderiales bacterium]|nr:diguanylate cyclase [Burkholderiales bacterium]